MCVRSAASALAVWGLLAFQLGGARALRPPGGPASSALDQLERSVTRPLPALPQPDVPRPDTVWVPDRFIEIPGEGRTVHVPGHWERRISEREFYVPPLVICGAGGGDCRLVPAGVRGPVERRDGP